LLCARNDGELMKSILIDHHQFEIIGELYDAKATSMDFLDLLDDGGWLIACLLSRFWSSLTKRNVLFSFSPFLSWFSVKLFLKQKKLSRFIFFLASHGHLDDDGRGWICTHGCNLNKLNSTCIKMSILKDFAESIDSRHQLYLLDCCHAGSLLVSSRGKKSTSLVSSSSSQYARAMLHSPTISGLTAVTKNQEALEEGGHGMFTRSFVEALQEGVGVGVFHRQKRNYVTTTELFSYVQRSVLELAKTKGREQTPRFEQLLIKHKNDSCNGQMLFFDWHAHAAAAAVSGGEGGGGAEEEEQQHGVASEHFRQFQTFSATQEKLLKRKSFSDSHMNSRRHRRSNTIQ